MFDNKERSPQPTGQMALSHLVYMCCWIQLMDWRLPVIVDMASCIRALP
jgi:hypothetical protein